MSSQPTPTLEEHTPDLTTFDFAEQDQIETHARAYGTAVHHVHTHVYHDGGSWSPQYRHWPDPISPPVRRPEMYYFVISTLGKPYWVRGDGMDTICASYHWIPASIAALIPGAERAREKAFFHWVYQD